jgi:hypothetical protein
VPVQLAPPVSPFCVSPPPSRLVPRRLQLDDLRRTNGLRPRSQPAGDRTDPTTSDGLQCPIAHTGDGPSCGLSALHPCLVCTRSCKLAATGAHGTLSAIHTEYSQHTFLSRGHSQQLAAGQLVSEFSTTSIQVPPNHYHVTSLPPCSHHTSSVTLPLVSVRSHTLCPLREPLRVAARLLCSRRYLSPSDPLPKLLKCTVQVFTGVN